MFVLEIKMDGEPPILEVEDTAEKCVELAMQMIDDGKRKDYGEIEKALIGKRMWKADGMEISIRKCNAGSHF